MIEDTIAMTQKTKNFPRFVLLVLVVVFAVMQSHRPVLAQSPSTSYEPASTSYKPSKHATNPAGRGNNANAGRGNKMCKDAAANKWLLDYVMAHHPHNTAEQTMETVRQVSDYAKEIREYCGDSRINTEVQLAAKAGKRPAWISKEIKSLLSEGAGRM